MWIMLIKPLPIELPVPPMLSVHWSTPWPMGREKAKSARNWDDVVEAYFEYRGRTPDTEHARRIRFVGRDIRIFPHEFSQLSPDKMMTFVEEKVLLLEAGDVASDTLIEQRLKKGQREIYDAALVDGCDHAQATMVALGKDPTLPDAEFPPIGWYRCAEEYAQFFV